MQVRTCSSAFAAFQQVNFILLTTLSGVSDICCLPFVFPRTLWNIWLGFKFIVVIKSWCYRCEANPSAMVLHLEKSSQFTCCLFPLRRTASHDSVSNFTGTCWALAIQDLLGHWVLEENIKDILLAWPEASWHLCRLKIWSNGIKSQILGHGFLNRCVLPPVFSTIQMYFEKLMVPLVRPSGKWFWKDKIPLLDIYWSNLTQGFQSHWAVSKIK